MNEYLAFLESKKKAIIESGFDVDENQLNPMLFDFQKFTVKRALKAGKYAIFADTGQGKTPMQLEIAKQVLSQINKHVLILAPLAVSGQTIEEGNKFHVEVSKYNKDAADLPFGNQIFISNYEQLSNIDENQYLPLKEKNHSSS